MSVHLVKTRETRCLVRSRKLSGLISGTCMNRETGDLLSTPGFDFLLASAVEGFVVRDGQVEEARAVEAENKLEEAFLVVLIECAVGDELIEDVAERAFLGDAAQSLVVGFAELVDCERDGVADDVRHFAAEDVAVDVEVLRRPIWAGRSLGAIASVGRGCGHSQNFVPK